MFGPEIRLKCSKLKIAPAGAVIYSETSNPEPS
jgi:hypothetical protein